MTNDQTVMIWGGGGGGGDRGTERGCRIDYFMSIEGWRFEFPPGDKAVRMTISLFCERMRWVAACEISSIIFLQDATDFRQ